MARRSSPYSLNKNKYLLDPEVERLEGILKKYLDSDARNCLLIFIALYTGARATEILNIKLKDINLHERSVFIAGIKGSRDREIPLTEWLFAALMSYVEETKMATDDFVFSISYPRLQQIWQLYRPTDKKFHSLRHTFAIRLYKKTRDLRLLQVALGHQNIANTMIYADYVYSQEELRRLIL